VRIDDQRQSPPASIEKAPQLNAVLASLNKPQKSSILSLFAKRKMSRDMVPINIRDPFMKDPFFSSTWDEFDAMRTEMMEKSKSFWGQVDKVIRRSENNGEIKPPQWESRS
jgi:hypothetical protein